MSLLERVCEQFSEADRGYVIRNVIESNSAWLCPQMVLESKEGVSLLERVCEQFSEADRAM